MNHFQNKHLKIIDSHTGGEPTRVVIDWPEEVTGLDTGELSSRRDLLSEKYDWIRTSCINEPRGHDAMVGGLLCKPQNPDCVAGVIFFNNVGYLHSCIHGTIGLAVTLLHMGRIQQGKHLIETTVGVVGVEISEHGSVTVTNVPSYRYRKEVEVNVPGYGPVTGDVAWGGNWFFLTKVSCSDKAPTVKYKNIAELTEYGVAISEALVDQGITGDDGGKIDHVEIFDKPTPGVSDSRSFVLCPGMEYDRSPCGTGTSAKLACLYADGELEAGQIWRQSSILETVFECRVEPLDNGHVTPVITGSAHVNAEATIIMQEDDPFRHGICPSSLPQD